MVAVPVLSAPRYQPLSISRLPSNIFRLSVCISNSLAVAVRPVCLFVTLSFSLTFVIGISLLPLVTVRVPRKAWRVIVIVWSICSEMVAQVLVLCSCNFLTKLSVSLTK